MSNQLAVCMKDDEKSLFDKYLSNCTNYFEYGGGGSTVFASSKSNIDRIYFVESNQQWVDKILSDSNCKQKGDRLQLLFHQINKNVNDNILAGHLDKAENQIFKPNWERYSKAILQVNADEQRSIDFVLVDGRFRVACCLMAILYTGSDCIIGIHDFYFSGKSCNRYATYCVVEKYLDKIEESSQLVIFKKKPNYDKEALLKDYENMKYEPL